MMMSMIVSITNLQADELGVIMAGIGILVGMGLLALLIVKVQGFARLLAKACGVVLQQICSLILETFFLFFKIVNSLEIYVVLLIDALTGKASSNGKIATLAIGVLSLASFYTTYTGMEYFIDTGHKWVSFLITLGIQAILLSTSLRLSDTLNLTKSNNNKFIYGKKIGAAGGVALGGCILAYLVPIVKFPYIWSQRIYHCLYLLVIVSVLACIFFLVKELVENSSTNRNAGVFLMTIYFAVLCVSSFFSYQSFVPVMYPEEIRNENVFRQYGVEVVQLLETTEKKLDTEYYENIFRELEMELDAVEEASKADMPIADEKISEDDAKAYEEYISMKKQLADIETEIADLKDRRQKEIEAYAGTNDGIGRQTNILYDKLEERYGPREEELYIQKGNIEEDMKELGKGEAFKKGINYSIDKYTKLKEKQENYANSTECSDTIVNIRFLLNKEHLEPEEYIQLQEGVEKIEQIKMTVGEGSPENGNNLWIMAKTYREYQEFRYLYLDTIDSIMNENVADETYKEAQTRMEESAQKLLTTIPETGYIFTDSNGGEIKTRRYSVGDIYGELTQIRMSASPDMSNLEKGLRTFLDHKIVGITCALMALLIDLMILFVGIILPPDINFESETYTAEDKKKILANLFNKPIGR